MTDNKQPSPGKIDDAEFWKLLDELESQANRAPPPDLARSEHQAGLERRELNEIDQVLSLRGRWSSWLITWISALITFQILLTIAVGWPGGGFNYQAHPYFLPLVIGQNVVQVVGMSVVIVKFLYPPGLRRILSPKKG